MEIHELVYLSLVIVAVALIIVWMVLAVQNVQISRRIRNRQAGIHSLCRGDECYEYSGSGICPCKICPICRHSMQVGPMTKYDGQRFFSCEAYCPTCDHIEGMKYLDNEG